MREWDEEELSRFAREELPGDPMQLLFEKQKTDLMTRVLKKHQEVEAKNSFIARIMSSLSDLLVVFSEDFTVQQASHKFYETLGYKASDELKLTDFTAPENTALIMEHFSGEEFRDLETLFINRSGHPVPVIVRGSTHATDEGGTIHMLIGSDRREFFEIMDRMREVQDQLIHSGRLASLGEMAAGIGHELTQPLNTMLLLARNCQKALIDPVKYTNILQENLSTIIDRINHASSIIHSLRGFAGKARGDMKPCRINIILLDVLNFMEAQLEFSGVEVILNMEEGDFFVQAQVVRLEQVMLNLIQNAVQAMSDCDAARLTLGLERRSGIDPQSLAEKIWVVISIRDNGCGISPEIEEKVFNPFFTTREVGVGMGLGLSIVERIVRSFGGIIKMNTIVGEGTVFSVWLPELEMELTDGVEETR